MALSAKLPSKNSFKESVQCLKFSTSVPRYQIKVLSTLSSGGKGRNPKP